MIQPCRRLCVELTRSQALPAHDNRQLRTSPVEVHSGRNTACDASIETFFAEAPRRMIMKVKLLTSAGISSVVAATGMLMACGQAADPSSNLGLDGTDTALQTVIGCQTQAFACAADAQAPSGFTSCNDGLRACLASLVPDAGGLFAPPTLPSFDAGFPTLPTPRLPVFDAGLPPPPTRTFDAGFPTLPTPPPVVFPDAGAPSEAVCLANLQTCLTSTFDVTTCAAGARTCLTAADAARCDALEAACISSGAPKALCDAQRTACP
jgi:hypothetical protein